MLFIIFVLTDPKGLWPEISRLIRVTELPLEHFCSYINFILTSFLVILLFT